MYTFYPVYVCEDFEVGNGILTIWGAKQVAQVKSEEDFNKVVEILKVVPNAIICPDLFHNRQDFSIVLFED